MKKRTVNVLGTKYTLVEATPKEDEKLKLGIDGYCDSSVHLCVVDTMECDDLDAKQNLPEYKKQVTRHELIHAFLHESGLSGSSWAANEELVDWIAIQFPKLRDLFVAADCL